MPALRRALLVIALAVSATITPSPWASAQTGDVTRLAIIGASETTGLAVGPGQGYADLLEADDPAGDNVLPLAHNGATARLWNTVYTADLDQLATWGATSVLVVIGGNDWYHARATGDYKVDLAYLVWQVRARVPSARVILWHDYPLGAGPDPSNCEQFPCTPQASTWGDYAAAMRQAAITNYAGYIDDSAKAPSGQPWSAYYGPDRLHLTAQGHQQLHDSIRARLLACC